MKSQNLEIVNNLFNEFLKVEIAKHSHLNFVFCDNENVPSTGRQIHAMYVKAQKEGTPFYVYSGSNDASFFSQETNLLYRAVHDLDHALYYHVGLGTTNLKSELFLNCILAKRAYDYVLHEHGIKNAMLVFSAVYNDTVGQAFYYDEHKDFVKDQLSFTVNKINKCDIWKYSIKNQLNIAKQALLSCLFECGVKS